MDVIPGVISEDDFMVRTAEKLDALLPLINNPVAVFLAAYFNLPTRDRAVSETLYETLGDKVDGILMSMSEQAARVSKLVNSVFPEDAASVLSAETMADLEWAVANSGRMVARIAPRRKYDYEAFISLFDNAAETRIRANKDLFYAPREKGKTTKAYAFISRLETAELLLKGMRYADYCNRNGVSERRRLEFTK